MNSGKKNIYSLNQLMGPTYLLENSVLAILLRDPLLPSVMQKSLELVPCRKFRDGPTIDSAKSMVPASLESGISAVLEPSLSSRGLRPGQRALCLGQNSLSSAHHRSHPSRNRCLSSDSCDIFCPAPPSLWGIHCNWATHQDWKLSPNEKKKNRGTKLNKRKTIYL